MFNVVLTARPPKGQVRSSATWRSFLDKETFQKFLELNPSVIAGACGYDTAAEAEAEGGETLSAQDCVKECMGMSLTRVAESAIRATGFPHVPNSGFVLGAIFPSIARMQLHAD